MKSDLTEILNREFRRVARGEDLSMAELVDEVARLCCCSKRMIYNYRTGKWGLPDMYYPIICKRFRSTAILDALNSACKGTPIEVPETYDLTRLISETVRDDLRHYEQFIDAFESNGIDQNELAELEISSGRVIQNVHQLLAIARSDYERRKEQRLHANA